MIGIIEENVMIKKRYSFIFDKVAECSPYMLLHADEKFMLLRCLDFAEFSAWYKNEQAKLLEFDKQRYLILQEYDNLVEAKQAMKLL